MSGFEIFEIVFLTIAIVGWGYVVYRYCNQDKD